jgi:Ca2+-binding RTX toxin-like protein
MARYYYGTNQDDNYNYLHPDQLIAYGEGGNDDIYGHTNGDFLFGGGGNDTLQGWSGNDYLSGDDGKDSLYGQDGNDILTGGKGDDLLNGGDGNDILNAFGNTNESATLGEYDTLTGGAGADIFVLGDLSKSFYNEVGGGIATITDFEYGVDKIQVYGTASDYTLDVYDGHTDIYYQGEHIGLVENKTAMLLNVDFNFVQA